MLVYIYNLSTNHRLSFDKKFDVFASYDEADQQMNRSIQNIIDESYFRVYHSNITPDDVDVLVQIYTPDEESYFEQGYTLTELYNNPLQTLTPPGGYIRVEISDLITMVGYIYLKQL